MMDNATVTSTNNEAMFGNFKTDPVYKDVVNTICSTILAGIEFPLAEMAKFDIPDQDKFDIIDIIMHEEGVGLGLDNDNNIVLKKGSGLI